jgi:membrane protein YdbS with pleckstrin-like domain
MAERTPDWMFVVFRGLEYWAIALVFLQIPWTLAALRLDYEIRWYVVTGRSLRIRHGLLTVHESTLSFVNIQQAVVTQGPLQRYLGLADVRVQSAGGGSGGEHDSDHTDSLHTAVFHAVENAAEIGDLVLTRLRQFRAAGLGDPDDGVATSVPPVAPAAPPVQAPAGSVALVAARELLAEAQSLRRAP